MIEGYSQNPKVVTVYKKVKSKRTILATAIGCKDIIVGLLIRGFVLIEKFLKPGFIFLPLPFQALFTFELAAIDTKTRFIDLSGGNR